MTGPELVIAEDPAAAANQAATRTAAVLRDAVTARGRADWAATGGSGPVGMFRALAEPALREAVPWDKVHVWWGDDRYVPRDHPLSNVKALDDILLDIAGHEEGTAGGPAGLPIPLDQVHPWPTGEAIGRTRGAAWCAATYVETLRTVGPPEDGGWPVFDLVMLGVGADGHVLSVFPGSAAIGATEVAMAIPAPTHIEPHVERVTLNPAVIAAARHVLVLATGAGKAAVLADIFGSTADVARWPAQFGLRTGATWVLDAEAAGELAQRTGR